MTSSALTAVSMHGMDPLNSDGLLTIYVKIIKNFSFTFTIEL